MGSNDATATLILKAKDLASKEIGGIGHSLGGLVSPAGLAAVGIGALVGGLGYAIKAAADEQINVEKMNAALKASIPGFDGNTDAIEGLISKREDLAFSDDDLRNSLALLVTSTHDVSQAQDLQATAMDLARLKGVDLATATTAVVKATQGSTKEIKALGLEVDETSGKTGILASIQKATAGQAAAYAGTVTGKWATFQNKMGDVVETIGGALLPIVTDLASFLADTVVPVIQQVADTLGPIIKVAAGVAGAIFGLIAHAFAPVTAAFGGFVGFFRTNWATIVGIAKGAANFLIGIMNGIIGAVDSIQVHIGRIGIDTPGGFVGVGPFDWNGLQIPRIPYLAEGGIVTRPTLAMIGEAGPEAVIPLGRGGGGGQPVELPIMLDGREIGRVVDRRLFLAMSAAGGSRRPR